MAYEQILAKLMTEGGPAVFQFDTSQTTIEQVVDDVLQTIASHLEGARRTASLA
jgi:broad-specificity NMP kinase